MQTMIMTETRKITPGRITILLILSLVWLPVFASDDDDEDDDDGYAGGFCSSTAEMVFRACNAEIRDDYWITRANCINLSEWDDRKECKLDAVADRREGRELCKEQYVARLELCDDVGEDRYDPDFEPDNFVNPLEIGKSISPNPYFPLVVGYNWVYEKTFINEDGEEGVETIRVRVTDKTKLIEGVTCLVINDIVDEDDEVIEDTDDWYAQDLEGNVWYCGEIAQNFETFEGDNPADVELVDIEGSWKAGRDFAKPGILIHRYPEVGSVYRQEVSLGDAEDVAEVVEVTGSESVPAASCSGDCLVTREFTPIEPGIAEYKYYAPGIGQILGVDMEGGREELIEFSSEY